MARIVRPYLLFLGDIDNPAFAKTAYGIRDWLPEATVGQWSLPGCALDLGLTQYRPAEAAARGARSLLLGAAPVGGALAESWIPALLEALDAGLDLVSGLHDRLADVPQIATAAQRLGRTLHDVRHPRRRFGAATGRKRSGRRILTVGTDCSVGKKYTALTLARDLTRRGFAATFRATGQTGIMIAGQGVAVDAVVSDFVAGAAEWLSPDADPAHWDVIEGQGSLFHPAYAGVTLGLLHGSQPDALVLCHDASRTRVNGYPNYPLPGFEEAMELYLRHARLTNPAARFIGLSLNTSRLTPDEAAAAVASAETRTGLPVFDPVRHGASRLVDVLGRW